VFYDGIEILFHGGLPKGLTKKQFFDGISKPRNATLMRIFLNMGLTEHIGHGIPVIIGKYGKEVFDISDNYIRCTIPFEATVIEHMHKNVGMNVGLNNKEKSVIKCLIENNKYTAEQMSKEIDVTKRTIERALL